MNNLLKDIKCFLLDLDGTLYIGNKLIDGAIETLFKIKQSGKTYKFLTNNSSKSIEQYLDKLKNLNIEASLEEIITSNTVAIDYLKSNFLNKKIYLIATNEVVLDYKKAGISIVNDFPDVLVLTYDTSLTYEKLAKAVSFINRGVNYIVTHADINCPSSDGNLPDLGSILECIYASTGKRPDVICGKPYDLMGKYVEKICKFSVREIAMVGDRIYTDMKFAINCGFRSVLTLSGETKKEMIKEKYDIIIDSIKYLFS